MIFVLIAGFATAAALAVVLSPLLTEARPARPPTERSGMATPATSRVITTTGWTKTSI